MEQNYVTVALCIAAPDADRIAPSSPAVPRSAALQFLHTVRVEKSSPTREVFTKIFLDRPEIFN